MTVKNIKYLLIIGFILVAQTCFPQVKRIGIPLVRNYEPSTLQAGSQTWKIDISRDGFAYFANNDGVLEFDGTRWYKYPLPGGNIVVRSVKTTDDGRIYAGGFNQLGYFYRDQDGLMEYHSLHDLLPPTFRKYGEVWKIYELPYGIVFQSYKQLMLYRDDKMQVIPAPGNFHFSFYINSELYINDLEQGLFRLAHNRLVKIPGTEQLTGQLIWSMLPMGNNILIATADSGIYQFDGIHLSLWESDAARVLQQNQVYCGLEVTENIYAFGTIQDGLLLCDTAGVILQHINLDRGLQNNTVLSMQLDQYRNLWLGLDNGIDYVEINSPLTYFTHYNNLSAGYAAVKHDSLLYLGTNSGVFYHQWESLLNNNGVQEFKIIPGTQGQVWELKVIDGTLFCGHNSGIYIIEGTSARKVSDVQGGWTFIQPEGREDILICGTFTSLVKFSRENGSWQQGVPVKGFEESSRFLANAGKDKLWMSHGYIGVFRLHFNESYDSVTKVEIYDSNNGFPSDNNINVFEILGQAVFTTSDGLYRYDVRSNSFIPDEEMNRILPGNDIIEVYEDEKGNVWYFTTDEAGVFRLQEDGSYFNVEVPFRELSGRFINWFQFVYPLNEDHVFFGIQDGFVHYSPSFPKNYKQDMRAFIREVELSGVDSLIYRGGGNNDLIEGSIPNRYNQIQFLYGANDFENPEHLMFSTFLEGFDEDWSAWQSRTMREFTNLKYGVHTFNVKAKNIFGTESNISSVTFEIDPPWFLKWYAYIIYSFILLASIFGMGVYVRYRMEKSKRQEEERQKNKFREIEKKLQTETLEAEKEVIKLRNERLNAEMKQKDKELANNTMQMIQKSKSLISIKKELSKLSRDIRDELVKEQINLIIRKINREVDTENQWAVFEKHFESVHEEFLNQLKIKFPDLTPRELKLCAYLRLNISSKEIATLMNISLRGVEISRYRLRKKFNLDHDVNLTSFIMSL
ncbi:MAG TPA: triple tyrosine motif-containing protein [Bacteroidales bacterium]|nr:triple tyrosine motif-containing protein [Bacteroidales bacterium]